VVEGFFARYCCDRRRIVDQDWNNWLKVAVAAVDDDVARDLLKMPLEDLCVLDHASG
jgi:hypothetical protein